jgi:hypothetical protein
MRQVRIGFTLLGLMVAGIASAAETPKEVTLFGQKYTLQRQNLADKYSGVQITLADDPNKGSGIQFVLGDTAANDRLFVATPFRNDASLQANQFFSLKGTTDSGVFDPKTASATEYFGGLQDRERGGRPSTVTFISDVDTGKQKDLNIALDTFTGTDRVRFYDLDTLTDDYQKDEILDFINRSSDATNGEPKMPFGGWVSGALGPNGELIFAGRSATGAGVEMNVFDVKNKGWFNALTNLNEVTVDQTTPLNADLDFQDIERLQGNEYLILTADLASAVNLDDDRSLQLVYRVTVDLPADLAKAEPGSIKAKVTGAETILDVNEDKDLLGAPTGVSGMAVGREVAAGGPRRLYFTTREGVLITANPVVAAGQ